MKEGRYTKTVTKFQVSTIFHMQDIQRNVVPKFIELCMETLVGSPYGDTNMVAGTNRNNFDRVLQRKREFTSQGTHKQVILFLIQGLFN